MWLTSSEWEHFIGRFADTWCIRSHPQTLQTIADKDLVTQAIVNNKLLPVKEKRGPFSGAELPQNRYLTHASLIQMQLSDSRPGKEHVTYCAPVLEEVDRELHSRPKSYLLTHLLLISLVPIAWMQTWVYQPNHAQPRQVTLMMKNKWELLLPPLPWVVRKPSRYEVDSSLPKAIRAMPRPRACQ